MPNTLDANGLTVATTDEISTDLVTALEGIFGTDINLDSNSPDGQMVGIFSQADSDVLDLLVDIYNMFSVDSAYGISLQRLVALNGMTLKPGSFTTTPVNITASAAGTLYGLDQTSFPPYQVKDQNNTWMLVSTYAFGGAGTQALIFQAASMGAITPLPNTITIQATPMNFVTAVNNPAFTVTTPGVVTSGSPIITGIASTVGMVPGMSLSDADNFFQAGTIVLSVNSLNQITASANATGGAPTTENITVKTGGTTIGTLEETDVALRIRHGKSFFLASTGPADAVEGQLLNLPDVTDALVIENTTGGTVNGVPAHSIWCIVVGGTGPEIAQTIYSKANPGCGLFGGQSVVLTRPNGQPVTINYDIGLSQPLFAEFGIVPTVAGLTFNNTLLIQELAAALLGYYRLSQFASIGDIVRAMFKIEPRAILVNTGVSLDGISFSDQVQPTSAKYYFNLPASNITIT